MYFAGTIVIDVEGTVIKMRPPTNFFGGIANLLARGSWSQPEAQETLKLLSLTQATYRVLYDLGVRDAIRIAVDDVVIYEDRQQRPDDFAAAMESLRQRIEQDGLELNSRAELDLVFSHDDGVLHYVIDLDFARAHRLRDDPLAVRITATSAELRRTEGETEDAYAARVRPYFADQHTFDAFRARLEDRFRTMLTAIEQGFRQRLGVENVRTKQEVRFVRSGRDDGTTRFYDASPDYGSPFYGYDPVGDLFYLMMWDRIFDQADLMARDFAYVDPGGQVLTYVGDQPWSGSDFQSFDETFTSDAGGGGSIDTGLGQSDAGGGGWLDSISDFFSSDSGGGGDVGGGSSCSSSGGGGGDVGGSSCSSSSSSCGGGSSCSSCGGGGGCGSS